MFCCTSVLIQNHEFGSGLTGVYWTPVYVVFLVTSVILLSGYLINFTTSKCYSKVLVSICLVLFFTSLGILIAGAVGFDKKDCSALPCCKWDLLGTFTWTFVGSFSAVSTPIFAIEYSFCSIFRDLHKWLAESMEFRSLLHNFPKFH